MNKVFDFLQDNWLPISAVIEAGLRLIPTAKNLSIIDNVFKVVSFLIKNRRKPSVTDVLPPDGTENKNRVIVDRFKHIIPVVLLVSFIGLNVIAPTGAIAQTNLSGKSIRFYNADSLTVKTEVQGLDLMYDSVGAIYYNDQASPAKFRIFYNHAWHDLVQASGGGGGVTIYSGDGILASDRTVNGDGNFIDFNDVTLFTVEATENINLQSDLTVDISSVDNMGIISGSNINVQAANDLILYGENSVEIESPSGGIDLTLTSSLNINGDDGMAGYVLTSSGSGASPQWSPVSGDNIYTIDGTLTGTRVLTGDANDLTFTGLNSFTMETDAGGANFSSNGTTIIESAVNTFIRDPSTFSYIQLQGSNGTVAVQVGTSGSTSSEFFISNGSQESPTGNGLLRVFKGNNVADNDTINYIYEGFALVDAGDGADGYGTGVRFGAENTGGGGNEQIGALAFTYKDAASGSEDSRFVVKLLENSLSYDAFEVWSDGTLTHVKISGGLPTACTGLGTGELANVGGVLNVCP